MLIIRYGVEVFRGLVEFYYFVRVEIRYVKGEIDFF